MEFVEFARSQGALPAFIPVTSRFATVTSQIGLDCIPVGISPYFDLESWTPSGRRAHALRSGISQATRAGITAEEVTAVNWPAVEIDAVASAWNASRKTRVFGWVFAPDLNFLGYKKLFVARDGSGKLTAFATASPLPGRNSFYLEDIQRDPAAAKGATDLLFARAMDGLRNHGAGLVTLGTVPLKGVDSPQAIQRGMYPIVRTGLNVLANHGGSVYNFAGVHTFKSRLSPTFWEHEYAIAPSGCFLTGPRVAFAALRGIMPSGIVSTVLSAHRRPQRAGIHA